jgi:hypothetical protein
MVPRNPLGKWLRNYLPSAAASWRKRPEANIFLDFQMVHLTTYLTALIAWLSNG